MSMTENERQEILKDIKDGYIDAWDNLVIDELFEQIEREHEEIQQYRAIGTVEQLEWCKDASHWKELFKEKLEQYESIGTIDEFKALKEKSVAKKPSAIISRMNGKYGKCPICNCNVVRVPYCERCGQKLSWQ